MSWFQRAKAAGPPAEKKTLGEGLFRRCDDCGDTMLAEEFTQNLEVCPKCGTHYRIAGETWVELLVDPGSFVEHDAELYAGDPLGFRDQKRYRDRIASSRKQTGLNDAFAAGSAAIDGIPTELGVFMFRFMGGSMGSVVGEKIARMFERGVERRTPVVLLSSSGGARMQEGVLSLMQMAKTVAALGRLRSAKLPFISVLLNPTTGGVAASFALLGDVNIAEPRALIGFAGPRVIENTIRQTLPEGFQRSEFLLQHGMIDMIAERREMRATVARVLRHFVG